MIRILVTGATGLLGRKLALGSRQGTVIIPTCRDPSSIRDPLCERLDVTDSGQVGHVIDRTRPDWVIHAAGITEVDRCEVDRELARRVNVEGTGNIARVCQDRGVRVVGISTDYVFDGTAGPYLESDPPSPLSYYGQTKLEGERIVLGMKAPGTVVRTMVLFGHAPGTRLNFVTWLVRSLREGKRVRVVTDQTGTPTLTDTLADFLTRLCSSGLSGIFHFAGGDLLSRYEMAVRICRRFGLDESLVSPVSTRELAMAAPRPLRSGLRTDKIRDLFSHQPTGFAEDLDFLFRQTDGLAELG